MKIKRGWLIAILSFASILIIACLLVTNSYFKSFFFVNLQKKNLIEDKQSSFDKDYAKKIYKNNTFGFTFTYPKSWQHSVLQEDLDCCGKILFFPQKSSNEIFNQALANDDNSTRGIVETIAPVKIDISRILSTEVNLIQLVKTACGEKTLCDADLAKDTQVAGQVSKDVDLKSPFEGKAIFLTKTYSGTAPSGRYLFKLSMRSDKQTQELFDVNEIKGAFSEILATFEFIY